MLEVVCHISCSHFSLQGLFLRDLDVENVILAQSFTCVEGQKIWKLNPALHLDTKCMLNRGSVPCCWWKRPGRSIYPVTGPQKATVNSDLKPDSEFTWISRQTACFLHADSLWGNLLSYERCFTGTSSLIFHLIQTAWLHLHGQRLHLLHWYTLKYRFFKIVMVIYIGLDIVLGRHIINIAGWNNYQSIAHTVPKQFNYT